MFNLIFTPDGGVTIGSEQDTDEMISYRLFGALEKGKTVKIQCTDFEIVDE